MQGKHITAYTYLSIHLDVTSELGTRFEQKVVALGSAGWPHLALGHDSLGMQLAEKKAREGQEGHSAT